MRFRKRIKIVKGLTMNLSGSGASLTVGGKGLSMNIGKNGAFLNAGIPGTGLYDRQKIGGGRSKKPSNSSNLQRESYQVNFNVRLFMSDSGEISLKVFHQNGIEIVDPSIIRKVKQDPSYKNGIEKLVKERLGSIEQNNQSFIEIYKCTPTVVKEEKIKRDLFNLSPLEYKKKEFPKVRPIKNDSLSELSKQSKIITSIFFWNTRKLREKYINDNLESHYEAKIAQWKKEKALFEENEDQFVKMENKRYKSDYEKQKLLYHNFLDGDEDYSNLEIERILSNITLPVKFSMDYEYIKENSKLYIDLDLPEIEDLPQLKGNVLASGLLKVKNKTQKEVNEDYARCILGLSFYFSGLLFNVTSKIKEIVISGFTQRLSKKDRPHCR